jgi:hypothetical protein
MRADYDSEADALAITLRRFDHYDDQVEVDDDYCVVGFSGGAPARVSLLGPASHLDLLDIAAQRFELDPTALRAAAQAALAAPDRTVDVKLAAPVVA